MNVEWAQGFLKGLPHVVETVQWGANLVFRVGDKAVGGKMFALMDLGGSRLGGSGEIVISYAAEPERYAELLECEGMRPAPYLARAHWVAVERWDVFRRAEWERELTAAHAVAYAKLPVRTRKVLALPPTELKQMVAERRKVLAAAEAAKKSQETPAARRLRGRRRRDG